MDPLDDINRTVYRANVILGVYRVSPEVSAVYPVTCSTAQPHRADLASHQGEAFDLFVTVQDDADTPSPFDLSRCLLRFAVKLDSGVVPGDLVRTIGLEGCNIVKRSPDDGIVLAHPCAGQARISINRADTADHPFGPGYTWSLEVSRPVEKLDASGQVRLKNGEALIMGFGSDFRRAAVGDLFLAQDKQAIITQIISNDALKTDVSNWTDSRRDGYEIWRAESRIVASGRWTCLGNTNS